MSSTLMLSNQDYRRNDSNMKFAETLYLAVIGLSALSSAAPLPVSTAMNLKRYAEALPIPFPDPLPLAEPAKRDAESLPEPFPEPIPEPQRPAKRDADADALSEQDLKAVTEPQFPARN